MAWEYGWSDADIGRMAFDTAQHRAKAASDMRRAHYVTLLDIAGASQGNDTYKKLRRELSSGAQAKVLVPKSEAEVVAMMKGECGDGV